MSSNLPTASEFRNSAPTSPGAEPVRTGRSADSPSLAANTPSVELPPSGRCERGDSSREYAGIAPSRGSEATALNGSGSGHLELHRVTDREAGKLHTNRRETPECPNPVRLVGSAADRETGEIVDSERVLELPCNCKGCEVCGERMRRRYVAHFVDKFIDFEKRGLTCFFGGLTIDPKVFRSDWTDLQKRKYLQSVWEKFRKRLNREFDEVRYVAVVEQHRSGQDHLHPVFAVESGDRSAEEVRFLLRKHWFESGAGVVMKMKPVKHEKNAPESADGLPDTLAGALGYCLKYAFKNDAEARKSGDRIRSVRCSQGDGYHAEESKAERQEYAERRGSSAAMSIGRDGLAWEWEPLYRGSGQRKGYADTLTSEDRELFANVDLSSRTTTYWEKVENDPDYGGRTVWKRWTLDTERDCLTEDVWDNWHEAEGAQIIHSHTHTEGTNHE